MNRIMPKHQVLTCILCGAKVGCTAFSQTVYQCSECQWKQDCSIETVFENTPQCCCDDCSAERHGE